jgi:carbon monoxide dehydrogenase subunit G
LRFDGTVNIQAPRDKVWNFLIDPHAISQCAPGLESLEVIVPDEKFKVVVSIGFGAVKVTFSADAEFVERDAPNRARIKAHGKAPGSAADVVSEMSLSDGPDGSTDMAWWADITVLGTIASLASRLMGGVTKKLTGAFFDCVKGKIEA